MLYYGIELASGTDIVNLTPERVATLPTGLASQDQGRLFFDTTSATISLWNGTAWITIGAADTVPVTSFNTRTGDVVLQSSDLTGLLLPANLPKATVSTVGVIKVGAGLSVAGDGTLSSSSLAEMPSGTVVMFGQPTAPAGWTQDTTGTNNRMIRVVNVVNGTTGLGGTGGGGTGGSHDPTVMSVVPAHTHTVSGSTSSDGAHTHYYSYKGATAPQSGSDTWCWIGDSTATTSYAGTHSHTVTGTTDNGS